MAGNSGFSMDVTEVEEAQEKMRSCLIDDPLQLPCRLSLRLAVCPRGMADFTSIYVVVLQQPLGGRSALQCYGSSGGNYSH